MSSADPRTLSNEALEMAVAIGMEIQFENNEGVWMKSAANNSYAKDDRLTYMSSGCEYRLVKK